MFNWRNKRKTEAQPRSLEELRKQLRVIDTDRLAQMKGGQGVKRTPPALKVCGGWLPQ